MYWMEGLLKIFPKECRIPKLGAGGMNCCGFICVYLWATWPDVQFLKINYRLTMHLFITPALPVHFSNLLPTIQNTQGCVQFHYSSKHLQVLSASFRNVLLIGWANVSDINQLTFDWKAGCWDCSVCRKSLNCLRAGKPNLKFSFIKRTSATN